jgi:riboflavin kinase/FMN adenylyltransferase
VDFCLVLNFTTEFAKLTAEEFVRDVVAGRLQARGIVLGHDSRFGRDRTGDFDFLSTLAGRLGVEVLNCEPDRFRGRPISSSLIREAVFAGRLDEARYLLGRPPTLIGTVVQGDRRGTALGFPTANLELHHAVRPPSGVYVAEVPFEGRVHRAVVNIGTRPTFKGNGGEALEVHLLDYPGGDLYGRILEVRFLARLRDEKKFAGPDELRKQIAEDVALARAR